MSGDSIRVSTPGGGGWGDPRERDPGEVRADVLRGFVSAKAAEAAYGVVLGGAPGFRVDEDATRKRRQEKKFRTLYRTFLNLVDSRRKGG